MNSQGFSFEVKSVNLKRIRKMKVAHGNTKAGAEEPIAQGCKFTQPLFSQLSKLQIFRSHFSGLKSNLRTKF